jgi:hypothetical protein
VLSLSPGRFMLVRSVRLHFRRSWRMMVAWCCNRHHKKRPDSKLLTANSVRALSFVCASLSLVGNLYPGIVSPWHDRRIFASSLRLGRVERISRRDWASVAELWQAYADPLFR